MLGTMSSGPPGGVCHFPAHLLYRTLWFGNTEALATCQATIRARAGPGAVQQKLSRQTGPVGTGVCVGLSPESPGGRAQEGILAEALEVKGYIVFQSGHNKEPQTGYLETTEMDSVNSGGWKSEIKVPCQQGTAP